MAAILMRINNFKKILISLHYLWFCFWLSLLSTFLPGFLVVPHFFTLKTGSFSSAHRLKYQRSRNCFRSPKLLLKLLHSHIEKKILSFFAFRNVQISQVLGINCFQGSITIFSSKFIFETRAKTKNTSNQI